MTKKKLSQHRVRELFDYCDGQLFWRVDYNSCARKGMLAGYLNTNGYWRVRIDGIKHIRSRLVWLWVNGVWPPEEIDHIDRNKSNDCIKNLRLASHGQNCRNQAARARSGYKGVYKHRDKWLASVRFEKKFEHIGVFSTVYEANRAAVGRRLELDSVFYAEKG